MSLLANPWVIGILGVVIAAGLGGSYLKGRSDGRAIEFAERATLDEVARVAREEATQAAATAISQIKVTHATIRGRVEREIIREKDYSACRHSDGTLRLLNDALTNRQPEPAGNVKLSGADTP